MYLVQRLIGVGVYALVLVMMFLLLSRVKQFKFLLSVYIFLLALLGFFYVPLSGSDLYRIQALLPFYANMSLERLFQEIISSSTPVAVLYYRIVGKLGDARFLPFITALISYGFSFGILKSIYNRHRNSIQYEIAVALLFFMSRGLLMMTIANIRTMLALSIVGFCIYKQLMEHQSFVKFFPLLIVAALIHNVALAAVLIYLTFYMVKGSSGRNKFLTAIEATSLFAAILVYGRRYIQLVVQKGGNYLSYVATSTGYFYIWEMLLSLAVLLITIIILTVYHTKSRQNARFDGGKEKKNYSSFVSFITALTAFDTLAIFVEFNAGLRLSWLISILDMPLMIIFFRSVYIPDNTKAIWLKRIVFCSFVILFVACARGDLCSLKFS